MGIKGKMWRVVGRIKHGLFHDCTLSPTLIYINGLLCEIEKSPELGVKFSENTLSSLPFADDF